MRIENLKIINQKIAGGLLIGGWLLVFLIGLIAQWNWLSLLSFLGAWLILVIFFYNPLIGFLFFLITRPAVDILSSRYSLHLTENISINLASALGILIIILTFIFTIKNKIFFFKIPLFWSMFFFWSMVTVSLFYSLNPFVSFYEAIRILSVFSIFILAYVLSQKRKNRKMIIQGIPLAALVPMSLAFFQLLTQSGLGGTTGIESRLYGTFVHPNSFASFLVLITALSFYLVLEKKERKKSYFLYLVLLLLSGFLLLETFSRGAWLAVLIFLFFYGVVRSPKVIIGGIILLMILFFSVPSFHDRIEDVYNPPADSSIVWRFQKWQRVLAVIKKHPWLGTGAGTEVAVHEKEYGFYAGNPYTHNDFLKIWLETGLMGLVLYLGLIINVLIRLIKKYYQTSKHKTDHLFVLIILLSFMAELVFSMSSNIWRGTATMWVLWTLVAAALALNKKDKK